MPLLKSAAFIIATSDARHRIEFWPATACGFIDDDQSVPGAHVNRILDRDDSVISDLIERVHVQAERERRSGGDYDRSQIAVGADGCSMLEEANARPILAPMNEAATLHEIPSAEPAIARTVDVSLQRVATVETS